MALKSLKVTGNRKYWAHYAEQDVRINATNLDYFEFKNGVISIKDSYRDFQGKLTIPAKFGKEEVSEIGNFQNMPNVTYIYFQNGSKCETIGNEAFIWNGTNKTMKLISIELPETIRKIGNHAFFHCDTLKSLGNNFYKITSIGTHAFSGEAGSRPSTEMALEFEELPSGLEELGVNAFYNCKKIKATKIPEKIKNINGFTFAFCTSLTISDFKNVSYVGDYAFYNIQDTVTKNLSVTNLTSIAGPRSFEKAYLALESIEYRSSNISKNTLQNYILSNNVNITFSDLDGKE